MNLLSIARPIGLAAALALAFPVAQAQDAPSPEDRAARHLQRVQERLDLTPAQAGLVGDALAKREPGALWGTAAALAPTLSAEQEARLTTRPERPERHAERRAERPERAPRADRPVRRERPANAERPQRPDRSGHFEAMKEARNAALGLRPDQIAAFDRLDAERRQRFEQMREQMQERRAEGQSRPDRAQRPDRAPRSPLPDEVAEILDPEQEAIWLTFHALSPHRGGPRAGR